MEFLGRRVVVRDVETERFGRTYAGQEGRILQFSRDPQTMEMREFIVDFGGDPGGVPFEPKELEFVD